MWHQSTKRDVDSEFKSYENRQRGINSAGHTSGMNNKELVFNQTTEPL